MNNSGVNFETEKENYDDGVYLGDSQNAFETCKSVSSDDSKTNFARTLYDYLETFCFALALMMVLFLFVFRYVAVDGDSMMDTLKNQDKLIISNLFYTPETGDIIVINPESHGDAQEPIIKRVIATEGQSVFIDYENWEVYVDGKKLDEPYIQGMRKVESLRFGRDVPMAGTSVEKYKSEFIVDEGKVFVMGDNRNNSKDSRSYEYGEMGVNRILGRVVVRLSPEFGFVD
jgi:signal peptidase I